MTQSHSHHHHHHNTEDMGDGRLVLAVIVNLLLTFAQIVGGVIAGSLALIADALHNFNDAASLGIALIARKISRKPADEIRTFGYRRAEVIGALINLTTLILVGLYLVYEAIFRFFEQKPIEGWIVIWVAGIALVIDLITAFLTYSMSKGSLNVKAAFIHNVSDAMASAGVILAGTLIVLYDFYLADLIVTLVISGYILWQGFSMISQSIRILMESAPEDLDLETLTRSISEIADVQGIHHVHVWALDESHRALEAHIVIDETDLESLEEIKKRIKDFLMREHNIHHSTLEFEPTADRGNHQCPDEWVGCGTGALSEIDAQH
ncbi:MAG: cation transporter [Candidatus Omnitrophica bacterium]|nr:cation transporter [Candidatus Omnitrophota bacterium]